MGLTGGNSASDPHLGLQCGAGQARAEEAASDSGSVELILQSALRSGTSGWKLPTSIRVAWQLSLQLTRARTSNHVRLVSRVTLSLTVPRGPIPSRIPQGLLFGSQSDTASRIPRVPSRRTK